MSLQLSSETSPKTTVHHGQLGTAAMVNYMSCSWQTIREACIFPSDYGAYSASCSFEQICMLI